MLWPHNDLFLFGLMCFHGYKLTDKQNYYKLQDRKRRFEDTNLSRLAEAALF